MKTFEILCCTLPLILLYNLATIYFTRRRRFRRKWKKRDKLNKEQKKRETFSWAVSFSHSVFQHTARTVKGQQRENEREREKKRKKRKIMFAMAKAEVVKKKVSFTCLRVSKLKLGEKLLQKAADDDVSIQHCCLPETKVLLRNSQCRISSRRFSDKHHRTRGGESWRGKFTGIFYLW